MCLRAGEAGLENTVRWPYVAENSGIAEWVLGGELVFVTGINHPRDEANLLVLLDEACQRQRLLEAAQAAGMPLIEQPYSLKMVLVTQAIGSALIQSQQLGRSRHDVLERLLAGDYQSLDLLLHRAAQLDMPLAGHWQLVQLQLDGSDALFAQGEAPVVEAQLARQHDAITRRLR
eukprot:gene15117-18289_t